MRKAILVGWLVIVLTTSAAAQEKGKWKYHESKEESTNEVTKYLSIDSGLPDIRLSIVHDTEGDFVNISFPKSITTQTEVAVEWRVDARKQIFDYWVVTDGEVVGCIESKRLLKQMLSGRRLQVRVLPDDKPPITISFDIKGLAYHAPKLGLK